MIIFLDIDGVLNDSQDFGANCFEVRRLMEQKVIVPYDNLASRESIDLSTVVSVDKLERFKAFAAEVPECKIILSSTWRIYSKALRFLCDNCKLKFHGETPYSNKVALTRGEEIEKWLQVCWNETEQFVIFDDDTSIRHMWFAERWVPTMFRFPGGLQDFHIAEAKKLLGIA